MLSMATRSGRVHCHHGLLLVRRHGDSFLWPLCPVFFKCLSVLTQVPPPSHPLVEKSGRSSLTLLTGSAPLRGTTCGSV